MDETNVLRGNLKRNWKNLVILGSFLFAGNLFSSDTSLYQNAYELEKKSTLFAIPVYESVLNQTQNPKLQKAAVVRLFFLYRKHNKLIEALLLGTRYSKIIPAKEKNEIWSQLAKVYEPATPNELMQSYTLVFRSKPDDLEELKFYLLSLQKRQVLDFVFLLLYKKKDYNLGLSLLRSDPYFQGTPLYEGMYLLKTNTESSREYLESQLKVPVTSETTASDLSFLLGHYFRNKGEHAHSARFFRMSQRGKLEAAKSLLILGNREEACKLGPYSPQSHDEFTVLLYKSCQGSDPNFREDWKVGIDLFAKKEAFPFLQTLWGD